MSKLKDDKSKKCPRVFIRWVEDDEYDTIMEYRFDVNGTLKEAEDIAKHFADIMDLRGIEYMSCYATTLYL